MPPEPLARDVRTPIMKRLAERLLAALAILSLLGLFATLLMPVAIRHVSGHYEPQHQRMGWTTRLIDLQRGAVHYAYAGAYLSHDDGPMVNPFPRNVSAVTWLPAELRVEWWPRTGPRYNPEVTLPLWPLPVLSGIGWWLLFRARRQREHVERAGLCPVCQYDLRATPGRCPECGTEWEGRVASAPR